MTIHTDTNELGTWAVSVLWETTPGWIPSSPTSPSQEKRQVPPTPKGLEETHPKDGASGSSTSRQRQPDPETYLGDKRKTTQQQNHRSCSLADAFKVFRNLTTKGSASQGWGEQVVQDLPELREEMGMRRDGKRCWETSPLLTPPLWMVFERLRALFG